MPLPFVAALSPKLARFASGAFFKVGFFAQGLPESLELENDILIAGEFAGFSISAPFAP
jgi:hypothetical protein